MLIVSALAIFLTWAVAAVVLIGIGSLLRLLFNEEHFLLDAFWMGLCLSVGILEIWNLFFPVTLVATILLVCLGVGGLSWNRSVIFNRVKEILQTSPWLVLAGTAIVTLIAFRASGPCDHYDTGLYGASAVRWIMTYPAVSGLANLHGRLGFNSSVFLCVAALGQGVWRDLAHHLFTGFVMAAMCLTILPACARLARRISGSPTDWFHGILAIPIFFWTTRSSIVGTQTDEPAAIACLVAVGIAFDELRRKAGKEEHCHSRLVVAASLLALAITFKESTIVFAGLAWCMAFSRIWMRGRSNRGGRIYIAGALMISAAILLPWFAHGITLSGYPFFPSAMFGFPGDWKAPLSVTNFYTAAIRSWGRLPNAPLADTRGFTWLGEWLHHALRNRISFQVPLVISLSGLAIALGAWIRRKSRPPCPWLWLLLPSVASIFFWFWASPDLRFAQFAIWTTAGTLGAWGIVSAVSEDRDGRAWVPLTALFVLMAWCLISFGWKAPYQSLVSARELSRLPRADVVIRHTTSGLAVNVPVEGNQCWDAPLPCTPYFDETLRLRKGDSMRWGFTSEARADELEKIMMGPPR
jgi:hypothetical protein